MKMPKIHIKRTDSKNHEATGQEKKNSFTTILPLQRVGQPKLGFGAGESVNASFSSQMMIFPGSWSPLNDAAICFMCLFPGERNICFLQNLKETKCLKNQRLFINSDDRGGFTLGTCWRHNTADLRQGAPTDMDTDNCSFPACAGVRGLLHTIQQNYYGPISRIYLNQMSEILKDLGGRVQYM